MYDGWKLFFEKFVIFELLAEIVRIMAESYRVHILVKRGDKFGTSGN